MEEVSTDTGPAAILYVEDEADPREMVIRTLATRYPALRIYGAANGAAGLELYREKRPEIVITDISMPVMDGIQMAREIKELNPEAIIIAMTAFSDTNYLLSSIEIGINNYLLKPTDYRKLFSVLDKHLQAIALQNQVREAERLHKKAQEQIEMLNTDLAARAQEMEAANRELEAFSYSVTHDLRKPLTVINGYCQVIKEMCAESLDLQCRGFVDEILAGTERMNQLIDALLKLSLLSRTELHRESVDLSAMAREIAAELRLTDPERQVAFRISDGIVVNGDSGLFRVVMDNLLGNAWKYTGNRKEARIEFGLADSDGGRACYVRDNGVGFSMADAEKIFLPFQRLPGAAPYQGHGIGLASVLRIIQRHGGRIWAEGEADQGATFYFTLPPGDIIPVP